VTTVQYLRLRMKAMAFRSSSEGCLDVAQIQSLPIVSRGTCCGPQEYGCAVEMLSSTARQTCFFSPVAQWLQRGGRFGVSLVARLVRPSEALCLEGTARSFGGDEFLSGVFLSLLIRGSRWAESGFVAMRCQFIRLKFVQCVPSTRHTKRGSQNTGQLEWLEFRFKVCVFSDRHSSC